MSDRRSVEVFTLGHEVQLLLTEIRSVHYQQAIGLWEKVEEAIGARPGTALLVNGKILTWRAA